MFKKFQEASKEFCSTRWHLSWAKYLQGSFPNSDVERLVTQCFKSVWVTAALHEGLLFPPGYGHLTSAPNTVHGQVVHWTLGALLYRTRFFPLRYEDTKIYCYKRTKKNVILKTGRCVRPTYSYPWMVDFDLLEPKHEEDQALVHLYKNKPVRGGVHP